MSQAHAHNSHGSVKSYAIGFLLSVILTAIPFWMVMSGALTKQATFIGIFAFAVVQIIVHLKYFLHLDFSKEGKLNSISFLFTGMVIVLLVGLSIWIIYTADALMMR
ncbi:cytochrome o ubiquinol oxidase subunit IV [Chromobacterium sphagni]|uniref:Cytochrome bo(3) ubiquinol oxidase subunit 4 n=1 Tax=Chromobacterium sphagni TaxID=1903179 RepID=A0ABX3CF67_9NEIS|nr:cytochrome o ubiquinol oxidase subunit IV [Chromobacterium sphagni]OHX20798.1 cytochrome o ubiquinol oxidase subunit IV [Chromobacterium sphagni]